MSTKKIPDGERFLSLLKERKLKQIDFAKKSGIHPMTVNRHVKAITLDTEEIKKITDTLDMELWEFFIDRKNVAQMCGVSKDMLDIAMQIEKTTPDVQGIILTAIENAIDSILDTIQCVLKRR